MSEAHNILRFPPARDCVRNMLGVNIDFQSMPDATLERVGSMMLYGAAHVAHDSEATSTALSTIVNNERSNQEPDLAFWKGTLECGKAIGSGQCMRWLFDAEQHEIVPRGPTLKALTIE